jgi:hypothetical protein
MLNFCVAFLTAGLAVTKMKYNSLSETPSPENHVTAFARTAITTKIERLRASIGSSCSCAQGNGICLNFDDAGFFFT